MSSLRSSPIACIDTETTGLGPDARVVEVAVIHTDWHSLPRVAYSARVNPGRPIEAGATAIHGITDADVADAPTFATILPELLAAIDGRVVSAYNAPYDYGRLRYELDIAGEADPAAALRWPWVDAYVLRKARPRGVYNGNKLPEVCAELGCTLDAHGAAGDAMALALALPHVVSGVDTRLADLDLAALLERQERRALEQEEGFVRWAREKGWQDRPDCPWHELAGLPLPAWPERPTPTARCPRCGHAPVTLQIAKSGDLAILNALGLAHRCDAP
jgi:DNA polymerase III epsilon subunit-like protein